MTYTPQTWNTGPDGGTPLSATRLNYIETGLAGVSQDADGKSPLDHTHNASTAFSSGTVPATRLPAATETAIGAAERATEAETIAGSDTTRYVSPATLRSTLDARDSSSGPITSSLFNRLIEGIVDPTLDTRVVCLGSSTMGAGNTSIPEQGVAGRLAYRSGATSLPNIDTATTTIPAGPMRWWNGAQGGTTSNNYYPTARQTQLGRIRPQYVLHMVGSNDWAQGVSPATYQANLTNAANSIESASPGVVNVFIHQQGRLDVPNPGFPWSAYANALRNVVAAKPDQRYFIDATEDLFSRLDTFRNNRWGLITADNIHMDEHGHLILADIIGGHLNIPSETGMIVPFTKVMAFPATTTYTGNGSIRDISEVNIPAAAYPRRVSVVGSMYARTGAGENTDIHVNINDDSMIHRVETSGLNSSTHLYHDKLIPPNQAVRVRIIVWINTGGIYVSGGTNYTRATINISPA